MPRESLTPGEPLIHISLALRPAQTSQLRRWAHDEQVSLSMLVRRAVDDYIARRQAASVGQAVAV